MKKLLLLSAALASSALCLAQEVGRVISSTPVMQQVGVPRQVCTQEQVAIQQPKSGAGALVGAIAGGAIGNAVGGGAGKAAATMLGVVGGAVIGDSVEGAAPPAQVQNVQRCRTQAFFENRAVAFNVVYEYAGKQYTVQLPNDPGPTLQLQISPASAVAQMAPPQGTVTYAPPVYSQPVYEQPGYVVVAPPAYPGYYQPGYYQPDYILPFALGLGFGFWGGNHGHSQGHGHWR